MNKTNCKFPILTEEPFSGALLWTLNRPNRCNALSLCLLEELSERLELLRGDREHRVLILHGAGRHFSSGLDLAEAMAGGCQAGDKSNAFLMPKLVVEILAKIQTLPQMVIAAPSGVAFGGGGALVTVADVVVASDSFRLGFPELLRGLRPALLHPFLSRRLSSAAIKELLLTPNGISAESARALGLVQQIVPENQRLDTALAAAKNILSGEPLVTLEAKKQLNAALIPPENERMAALNEHFRSWRTPEAQEGIAAFLEKRSPNWR